MVLRIIYTLFIGVIFAILVGVGVAAFYPEPKMPEYPSALKVPRPEERLAEPVFLELRSLQENYDKDLIAYQQKEALYNRNVSLISIALSVATLVVSLTFFQKILLIADGLLLGGVLTLFYSLARGFGSGNDMFRFIVVAIGFVIAIFLGYTKLKERG